jgi:hypothetical protein
MLKLGGLVLPPNLAVAIVFAALALVGYFIARDA